MTSNKVPNHLMDPETVDYQFAIQNMESVVIGLPGQEGEQPPQVIRLLRLLHAKDGICTEAGEFADQFKRHVYYHQPLNETNLIEELGDIMWYVALACNVLGVTIGAVQIANIRKLQKRYPEKFTVECATNRNVTAEIDALLDKVVAEDVRRVPLTRTDIKVYGNSFHPGTLKSGWSQLHISGKDAGKVNQDISYLVELGWEPWIVGEDDNGEPSAVLFRPFTAVENVYDRSLPNDTKSPPDGVDSSVEGPNDSIPDGPVGPEDARLGVSLASGESQDVEFGLGTAWKHKATGAKGKVVGRANGGITSGLPWNHNWFALLSMEVPFNLAIMAIRDRGFATAVVVDSKGIHQVGVKKSDISHWELVK